MLIWSLSVLRKQQDAGYYLSKGGATAGQGSLFRSRPYSVSRMVASSGVFAGGAGAPAVPRPRRVPAAAAATAAAGAATPLPLLPFFAEFR